MSLVLISTHNLPVAGKLRDAFRASGYRVDLVTPTEELYREAQRARELNSRLFERIRATGAIRPDDILRPHCALLPHELPRGVCEGHGDRVLVAVGTLGLRNLEAHELEPVVGAKPGGRVGGELGEVVEHTRLIDDQVRELADAGRVVDGAGGSDDP